MFTDTKTIRETLNFAEVRFQLYSEYLYTRCSGCQFISTVQERSADWSIELLLKRYSLQCSYEHPHSFLRGTGIAPSDLTGDHNIFVLKIFLKT